jgi:hypothetical protein
MPSLTEIIKSINYEKKFDLINEYNEWDYNPYVVNKIMSQHVDTLFFGNEMNARPHIPKPIQYKYYCYSVKKGKRFGTWLKAEKNDEVKMLSEYLGISYTKAKQLFPLLDPESIQILKKEITITKGG